MIPGHDDRFTHQSHITNMSEESILNSCLKKPVKNGVVEV